MIKRMRATPIAKQIALLVFIVSILSFGALSLLASSKVHEGFTNSMEHELQTSANQIDYMLSFYNKNLMESTDRLADIFFTLFPGGIKVSDTQTVKIGQYDSPLATNSGETINLNFAKPDQFTKMTGGTTTVFIRSGDDFLRISTSLKKADGTRAYGTFLGKNHPGYTRLIKGEIYEGPATLFGRHYMTKYVPFKDASGKVMGILYVGFDYSKGMEELENTINSLSFSNTGKATVINLKEGKDFGKIIIDAKDNGKSFNDIGVKNPEQLLSKMKSHQKGIFYYQQTVNGHLINKIMAFKKVDSWHWGVITGGPVKEFTKTADSVLSNLIIFSIICAIALVVLIAFFVKRLLAPLKEVGNDLKKLGNGNLSKNLFTSQKNSLENSNNEIDILLRHGKDTIHQLRSMQTDIKECVELISNASEDVQKTALSAYQGITKQQTETDLVTAAISQLAISVDEVSQGITNTTNETQRADEETKSGTNIVDQVTEDMQGLANIIGEASNVMLQVETESERISSVLDVIRSIAEQTNLLALNAAIEAARAGEQ